MPEIAILTPMKSTYVNSISIAIVLAAVTFAVYTPALKYGFVNFDDNDYVYENRHVLSGLNKDSIIWAFTKIHANNYHPITWLSHMLDVEVFKDRVWGHHLTNIMLHVLNSVLLFWVFLQMTGRKWAGAFVAALFALHPLHVESVAWISERKDVLSTFFWMLTMLAYVYYVQRKSARWYMAAIVLCAMGLLAKPMVVTLPCVLVLMDYWPLNRLFAKTEQFSDEVSPSPSIKRIILEKVPFFLMAFTLSAVTFIVQRVTGAMASLHLVPLWARFANMPIAYSGYIIKMLWPAQLSVLYIHPSRLISMTHSIIAAAVLIPITAAVVYYGRRIKWLMFGWFWYLGTLVPVIGLVQVGNQYMADRYTYIPLIGLFVIAAWGVPYLFDFVGRRKIIFSTAALAVLMALSVRTVAQVRVWQNGLTLFKNAIDVDPENYIAHYHYGQSLRDAGRLDEAFRHYEIAIKYHPGYADAYVELGGVVHEQGQFEKALTYFESALKIKPHLFGALANMGLALSKMGRYDEAAVYLDRASQVAPDNMIIYQSMADNEALAGRYESAKKYCRILLDAGFEDPKLLTNYGFSLVQTGEPQKAVEIYRRAIELEPNYLSAYNNLGFALLKLNQIQAAAQAFTKALSLKPDFDDSLKGLGDCYLLAGNVDQAIDLYQKALQINPNNTSAMQNLNYAVNQKQNTGTGKPAGSPDPNASQ